MDAVMLQLSRARNRLTTPATLTLPEIASSGLTVSVWWARSLYRSGSIAIVWILGCILVEVGFWSVFWGRTEASANLEWFWMLCIFLWECRWLRHEDSGSLRISCVLYPRVLSRDYLPLWTLLHPFLLLSCTYHLIKGSESCNGYLQLLSLFLS